MPTRLDRLANVLAWAPIGIALGIWFTLLVSIYTIAYVIGGHEATERVEHLLTAAFA